MEKLNSRPVLSLGHLPIANITACTIGYIKLSSTRFVVKPEGVQQCIFDVFLTKTVGVGL